MRNLIDADKRITTRNFIGETVAARLRSEVTNSVVNFRGLEPGHRVILGGEGPFGSLFRRGCATCVR